MRQNREVEGGTRLYGKESGHFIAAAPGWVLPTTLNDPNLIWTCDSASYRRRTSDANPFSPRSKGLCHQRIISQALFKYCAISRVFAQRMNQLEDRSCVSLLFSPFLSIKCGSHPEDHLEVHRIAVRMNLSNDFSTQLGSTCNGIFWIIKSFAFFGLTNHFLRWFLPPSIAASDKHSWRWRNTANSMVHALITGVWSLAWLVYVYHLSPVQHYKVFSIVMWDFHLLHMVLGGLSGWTDSSTCRSKLLPRKIPPRRLPSPLHFQKWLSGFWYEYRVWVVGIETDVTAY